LKVLNALLKLRLKKLFYLSKQFIIIDYLFQSLTKYASMSINSYPHSRFYNRVAKTTRNRTRLKEATKVFAQLAVAQFQTPACLPVDFVQQPVARLQSLSDGAIQKCLDNGALDKLIMRLTDTT
jgi:argonaute-like protein implicated in RNA metabolism and viral defense